MQILTFILIIFAFRATAYESSVVKIESREDWVKGTISGYHYYETCPGIESKGVNTYIHCINDDHVPDKKSDDENSAYQEQHGLCRVYYPQWSEVTREVEQPKCISYCNGGKEDVDDTVSACGSFVLKTGDAHFDNNFFYSFIDSEKRYYEEGECQCNMKLPGLIMDVVLEGIAEAMKAIAPILFIACKIFMTVLETAADAAISALPGGAAVTAARKAATMAVKTAKTVWENGGNEGVFQDAASAACPQEDFGHLDFGSTFNSLLGVSDEYAKGDGCKDKEKRGAKGGKDSGGGQRIECRDLPEPSKEQPPDNKKDNGLEGVEEKAEKEYEQKDNPDKNKDDENDDENDNNDDEDEDADSTSNDFPGETETDSPTSTSDQESATKACGNKPEETPCSECMEFNLDEIEVTLVEEEPEKELKRWFQPRLFRRGIADFIRSTADKISTVESFGDKDESNYCELAYPTETPLRMPSWGIGAKLFEQDKDDEYPGHKDMPRWYTTTVVESKCTPTAVAVEAEEYDGSGGDSDPSLANMHSASSLRDFFGTIIDYEAQDVKKWTEGDDRTVTCEDLRAAMFGKDLEEPDKNELADIWDALPGDGNWDFVGMSHQLNREVLAVYMSDKQIERQYKEAFTSKVGKKTKISKGLSIINKKLQFITRMDLGRQLMDDKNITDLIQRPSQRIYKEMDALDTRLAEAKANNKIPAFHCRQFSFATAFRTYQKGHFKKLRKAQQTYGSRAMKSLSKEISTLEDREETIKKSAKKNREWADYKKRFEAYKADSDEHKNNWAMEFQLEWPDLDEYEVPDDCNKEETIDEEKGGSEEDENRSKSEDEEDDEETEE